jgi:hypothetical protein
MSGEQLGLAALPVAAPEFEIDAAPKRRLEHVLARARAFEDSPATDMGPWWLGSLLAEYMREPIARLSIDLHRLRERGALEREVGGTDPRGRTVYLWAVRRRPSCT